MMRMCARWARCPTPMNIYRTTTRKRAGSPSWASSSTAAATATCPRTKSARRRKSLDGSSRCVAPCGAPYRTTLILRYVQDEVFDEIYCEWSVFAVFLTFCLKARADPFLVTSGRIPTAAACAVPGGRTRRRHGLRRRPASVLTAIPDLDTLHRIEIQLGRRPRRDR